jgi:hypothetical protein
VAIRMSAIGKSGRSGARVGKAVRDPKRPYRNWTVAHSASSCPVCVQFRVWTAGALLPQHFAARALWTLARIVSRVAAGNGDASGGLLRPAEFKERSEFLFVASAPSQQDQFAGRF